MVNGYNGPGWPGSPDLVGRLLEHGAGGAGARRGLFLRNYWTTRRRKRGGPVVRDDLRALIDYALDELMRRLRDQPGINVRMPSHHDAPFRSVPFTFELNGVAVDDPAEVYTVAFNGNLEVPDGLRGVISHVEHYAFDVNPNDATRSLLLRDQTLTVLQNGLPVPGYSNLRPSGLIFESITDGSGSDNYGASVLGPVGVVPIQLQPGDVLEVALQHVIGGGAINTGWVRLQGWLYPIELEADGIMGTLADRGSV